MKQREITRKDMIPKYTRLLFDIHGLPGQIPEVVNLNKFIIDTWSNSALIWIKDKSWSAANKIIKHYEVETGIHPSKGFNIDRFRQWLDTTEGKVAFDVLTTF